MGEQLKAHQPCPDCNSSDALTYYDWGSRCFSCGKATRFKRDEEPTQTLTKVSTKLTNVHELTYQSVVERKLTRDTCLSYGIGVKDNSYYFPYYSAVRQGVEPISTKKKDIDAAMMLSNEAGKAFDGNTLMFKEN